MQTEEAERLTQLEKENAQLKRLLAEAELEKAMFKELARETSELRASPQERHDPAGAASKHHEGYSPEEHADEA